MKLTTSPLLPNLFFIGAGRTGASLAFFFLREGYPIISLTEKNPQRLNYLKKIFHWNFLNSVVHPGKLSRAEVIFLTVRDDQLPQTAKHLSTLDIIWKDKLILHCSGALSSQVLNPLYKAGAEVASFHPIYSFALDPRQNNFLNQAWISIEGKLKILGKLERYFNFHKHRFIRIKPSEKEVLHLACVFYSNFYVALAQMGQELLKNISLPEKKLFRIFHPLLQSAVEQLSEHEPAGALTGPVARADCNTLSAHLKYLRNHHSDLLPVYLLLSKQLILISNLSPEDKSNLKHLFQKYQKNFRGNSKKFLKNL